MDDMKRIHIVQSVYSQEPSAPILQKWNEVAAIHELQMLSYERREKEHLAYTHNRTDGYGLH